MLDGEKFVFRYGQTVPDGEKFVFRYGQTVLDGEKFVFRYGQTVSVKAQIVHRARFNPSEDEDPRYAVRGGLAVSEIEKPG